jgi:glyoxylase-like metal-dependent hydrolase (beta-lactamase superfamily II)/rhodanese-related sulfurtransferase
MGQYSAAELYHAIETKEDFILLDVRNEDDYNRFAVEGPEEITTINLPYFDFIEDAESSTARVPAGKKIRVICAKEGSSQLVYEVLTSAGRDDISYLTGGVVSWGNLLVPKRINNKDETYEMWQFNRPGKASCSYGLINGDEMFLFDPSRNVEFYSEFASQRGATITHTFETHLQADYISGSPGIVEQSGATFVANSGDYSSSMHTYHEVSDGEQFTFSAGGPKVLAIHSPGHTPGSTTYIVDERFMISGDTIFIVSIGRPDLGKQVVEWAKTLYSTLKTKITTLPEGLMVLPGHYTNWETEADGDYRILNTFGTIQKMNEEIYTIDDEGEFVTYIKDNMRAQPPIYAQIRQINMGHISPCPTEQNVMDLGKNECAASSHIGTAL